MEAIKRFLGGLSLRQKITLAVAPVLVVALLVALVRWNKERNFRPLFYGLAPEEAGEILTLLQQSQVPYRVADGGATILVPSEQVAEVRLRLAAAGYPRTGRIGFELFDKNQYGVTEFAEQVNYHRALEGELERSVSSLVEVEKARVHITLPKDSVFLEAREPAKASVLVKLRPGARLSQENVQAICHLVASAVQGLTPERVSVLDMHGNLLNRPRSSLGGEGAVVSEAQLDYQKQLEQHLLAKIRATLEPLLGPDRFRAAVSVECDFSSGEQSEEIFDPARSVMTRSDRTEDVTSGPLTAGIPGTASNLPRPPASVLESRTTHTRRTESISYASTRTVRRMQLPRGTIKRISASVLLDYDQQWEGAGERAKPTLVPPSAEKIQVIRQLVTAALGLDEQRGDRLVIESLPFEREGLPTEAEPRPTPAPWWRQLPVPGWVVQWLQKYRWLAVVAAGVVLALLVVVGVGAWWLRRRRRLEVAMVREELPGGVARQELEAGAAERIHAQLPTPADERQRLEQELLRQLKEKPVKARKSEVLAKLISEETKKDATGTVQVIRTWLEDTAE